MATFTKTQGISTFANGQGVSKIDILKNPKTGKLFGVTDSGLTFRIAKDVSNLTDDLNVSWFSPEDGEASWMIHRAGQGAEAVSTMTFGTPSAKAPVESKSFDIEL